MKNITALLIFTLSFTFAKAQITIAYKNVMREKADLDLPNQWNIGIIAKKTNDNKIIIVRSFKRNNAQSISHYKCRFDSVSITKFDLNGNTLWQKRLAFNNSGYVSDICPTADGGYIICGDQNMSNFVLKIDANGNSIGVKEYDNPNSNYYFNKIIELSNGNYAIASIEYIFRFASPEYSWTWWSSIMGYRHYYTIKYTLGLTDAAGNVQWSVPVGQSDENYYQYGVVQDRNLAGDKFNPKLNVNIYPVKVDNNDYIDIAVNLNNATTSLRSKSIIRYNTGGTVAGSKTFDTYNAYRYNSLGYWKVKDGYLFMTDSSANNVYRSYFVKMDLFGTIKGYYQTAFLDWEYGRNLESAQIHINGDSTIFLFEKSQYGGNKLVRCFKDLSVDWNYSLPYIPEREYGNLLITETDDHNLLVVSDEYNYDQWENVNFYKLSSDAAELHYQVYIDRNDNNRFDAADTTFNECIIYQTHNGVTQQFYPDYYGKYEMFADTGIYESHIESYSQTLKYYFAPATPEITHITSYTQEDTVFFKLVEKKNVRDLQISLAPYIPVRPGFQSSYTLSVGNIGTVTVQHPRALFIKDPLQSFDTLTAPFPFRGDTMFIEYDSLTVFQQQYYEVYLNNPIPPIIEAGDTIYVKAVIEPIDGDIYPDDNVFELTQTVVNSYDPNDKLESHGGAITQAELANGDYLYYTIRFQNAGNYYASIIKITDTLSDKLDWSTLEVLTNSHNLEFKVENQRYLTWWSNNFYLPDSTSDEPGSHGFVSFRIKPIAGLSVSDEIDNKAHIYFDYNPPIETNTVTTKIVIERILRTPKSLIDVKKLKVYPNPTNDLLTMDMTVIKPGKYTIQLLDFSGRNIRSEEMDWTSGKQLHSLSLQGLENGMYILSISNPQQKTFYTSKILKQ